MNFKSMKNNNDNNNINNYYNNCIIRSHVTVVSIYVNKSWTRTLFIFFDQNIPPVGRYVSQARAELTKLSRVHLEYYLLSLGHCNTTQVIYEKVSCQTSLMEARCIVFSDKVIVLSIAIYVCLSVGDALPPRLPASMQMYIHIHTS